MTNLNKFLLGLILIELFNCQMAMSQGKKSMVVKEVSEIRKSGLEVGDKVPDVMFERIINYPTDKAKLSDFKGKYVILDFWNRYCASCIASFPKMQKLQDQFKDSLQILLVTTDAESELEHLFKKSYIVRNTRLPMVLGEKTLSRMLFPHTSVPYHVWLDPEGKVKACVSSFDSNYETLSDLIANRPFNVLSRKDLMDEGIRRQIYDDSISLLSAAEGRYRRLIRYYYAPNSNSILGSSSLNLPSRGSAVNSNVEDADFPSDLYYSIIMNSIPGNLHGRVSELYDSKTRKPIGIKCINTSILALYKIAYQVPYSTNIFIEKDAQSFIVPSPGVMDSSYARWYSESIYCYESSLPVYDKERSKYFMQQDLQRYFGVKGVIEHRPVKSLVLYCIDKGLFKINKVKNDLNGEECGTVTKEGILFSNCHFINLFYRLMLYNEKSGELAMVNETGIKEDELVNLLIRCESLVYSPKLKDELASYGLAIREEYREMKVLVLKKGNNFN